MIDLTNDEVGILLSILENINFKLGDAALVEPIHIKLKKVYTPPRQQAIKDEATSNFIAKGK